MRVLLVDDEPLALERLRFAFGDIPGAEVVGAARDGEEAGAMIAALRPDLVILDVQMPGRTGLAVAAGLDEDQRPEIVFVTAFEHYGPDAFEVEAADYLLKPVRFDRLKQAVERARRRRAGREALDRSAALAHEAAPLKGSQPPAGDGWWSEIWTPGRHGMVRVPVDEIEWIEAARDYVLLHTRTRSHILRATMGALEKRLDPARLARVHRSAFVRLEAVQEVQRPGKGTINLLLRDGAVVQVGPNYAAAVLRALRLDPQPAV